MFQRTSFTLALGMSLFAPAFSLAAPVQTPSLHTLTIPSRYSGQQPYEAPTLFAFSPDGRTLATGAENCQLLFWDVRTGKPKRGLERALDGVYEIHYSPDGRLFATGTSQLVGVSLWDARSGQLVRTLKEPYPLSKGTHVYDFSFSPDGKTIASTGNGEIQIWDVATGRLRRKLKAPDKQWTVAYSPDGNTVAGASTLARNSQNEARKTVVHLWDTRKARLRKSRVGAGFPIAFSPDGRLLLTRLVDPKHDDKVGKWRLASDILQPLSSDQITANGDATPVAISPNSRFIATGHRDGRVQLRSARTGALLQTLRVAQDMVTGVAFSPDGTLLVSAAQKGQLKFWRLHK